MLARVMVIAADRAAPFDEGGIGQRMVDAKAVAAMR
jgi:hypothetical protein